MLRGVALTNFVMRRDLAPAGAGRLRGRRRTDRVGSPERGRWRAERFVGGDLRHHRRMAGRWRVAAVLVGCARRGRVHRPVSRAADGHHRSPTDVLAGISVEVRQGRSTWAQRVVQVRVTNAGPGDVSVTGVRLTTPDVEGVASTDKGRILRAGVDRDFSVALGDPVCDDAGSGPARAEVDLTDDAGRRSTVVVEPADPQGHLARIHGEDCAGVAVAAGGHADAGGHDHHGRRRRHPRREGRARASTPVAGGPRVEVTQVDRTILFAPPGGAVSWPVALDTAAAPAR